MADEKTIIARNAVDRNMKVLMAIDLELNAAEASISLYEADRARYRGNPTSSGKKKYFAATVEMKKAERFAEAMREVRKRLLDGIDSVIGAYKPTEKAIWVMYFIHKATVTEIASKMPYSKRSVEYMIQRFKNDLVECSIDKEKEQ